MKDFLGKEIKVGDKVIIAAKSSTGDRFYKGVVGRFTPKFVVIARTWKSRSGKEYTEENAHYKKAPHHMIVINCILDNGMDNKG